MNSGASDGQRHIATGTLHSCAVVAEGRLYCWGDNGGGQLGSGNTVSSAVPVAAGSDTDWESVTAGDDFTCGLKKESGTRYCWGGNDFGELGNGGGSAVLSPAPAGDSGWVHLSAGARHACGLKGDGALLCWGDNRWGQLADPYAGGPDGQSNLPHEVAPRTQWLDVSAGAYHTCAVKSDRTLFCWGGAQGANSPPPTQVGSDADWAQVDAGEFVTCGTKTNGALFCFGRNTYGEAGRTASGRDEPLAQVGTEQDWASVRVGGGHACALKTDGALYCWGYNYDGQAGVPITAGTFTLATPTRVAGGTVFLDIDAGGSRAERVQAAHTCGVLANGALACWGSGSHGQLGNGETDDNRATPSQVGSDTDWASLGHGSWATKSDGVVWQWGDVGSAQINATTGSQVVGIRQTVPASTNERARTLGRSADCYVASDGTLRCLERCLGTWDPGIHTCADRFAAVGTDNDWATVSGVGLEVACALKASGDLYCWGDNTSGALGNGTTVGSDSPIPIASGSSWLAVATSLSHTCAVRKDRTLWCWGANFEGELGDGTLTERLSPTQVGRDGDWVEVTVGLNHSCGRKTDGSLYCFGDARETGTGDTGLVKTPTRVGGEANFLSVAAFYLSTCAVKSDHTAWCWGSGGWGQLGDGRRVDSSVPVEVAGGYKDWLALGPSDFHTCGLRGDGTLWCWGNNDHGDLSVPVVWKDALHEVVLPAAAPQKSHR